MLQYEGLFEVRNLSQKLMSFFSDLSTYCTILLRSLMVHVLLCGAKDIIFFIPPFINLASYGWLAPLEGTTP
jgi:hypothetical protein